MSMAPIASPAPVPPPQHFHQLIPPNPIVYDQSFFIGDTKNAPLVAVQQQHALPGAQVLMAPSITQRFRLPIVPQQMSSVQMVQQTVPSAQMMPAELSLQYQQQRKLDKEAIAKLFNDKQITLTDFLSITSKVAGSDRPVDLANKIKVISRCQDAVKAMSKDSKVSGRFFMRKRSHNIHHHQSPPSSSDNKLISPLKRSPAVRFWFTSKVPVNDDTVHRTSVQLLLHNLGLPDGTEPIRDPTPEPSPTTTDDVGVVTNRHQATIVHEANNLKSIVPVDDAILTAPSRREVLQKMCQTDPVNLCRECNVRAQIKFVSVGCQWDERMSVSVGTQVNGTEDTFTPARANLQGLLKNRSLASLTPAQILAQVATTAKATEPSPIKNDLPFAVSPELKRRADLSANWQKSLDYDRLMTANRQTDRDYNKSMTANCQMDRDYDRSTTVNRQTDRDFDKSMTANRQLGRDYDRSTTVNRQMGRDYDKTCNRRSDIFNYNEQQQERHLQQQLQMTMDMQQKNRLVQMNRFPGNPSVNNSGISGNTMSASFPGSVYGNNSAAASSFNSGMSGSINQFGSNNGGNPNFGGNRFYN